MSRTWRIAAFLLAGLIACMIACGGDDGVTYERPRTGPVIVTITADKNSLLKGQTVTLTCTYYVANPRLPSYATNGYFKVPPTNFTVVSGESSWVDTVLVNETRTHKVAIRPIVRGNLLADAIVYADIDSFYGSYRGVDYIELHVK